MALFNLPQPRQVSPPPMLVLGAANDTIFTQDEIEATARAYNATSSSCQKWLTP